jgi:hypothetical protein
MRPPDPAADQLAEMLAAAVRDAEWGQLDHALTGRRWQEQLVPLIDRICERLTQADQQKWTHLRDAALIGGVAAALVRVRDGTAAQERRRRELDRRLSDERNETAAGLYPPPPGHRPRLALVIVCGVRRRAGSNWCGAERARAFTVPNRQPNDPLLIVRNAGRMDLPHRLEAVVPPDFSGGTDAVYGYENACSRDGHNILRLDGELIRGMGVQMPFELLKKPYRRFTDPAGSGKPVRVPWAPGAFPTLYRGRLVGSPGQPS